MSPVEYTAVGVTALQVVPAVMWLSDWPLRPMDATQAASVVSLVLGAIALVHATVISYRKD